MTQQTWQERFLFQGETVYDDGNSQELMGDGNEVIVGGERRILARLKPGIDADPDPLKGAIEFEEAFPLIPRSEWDDRLEMQLKAQARVSDHQDFDPYDQNGLPTCWANGPCAAASTACVIAGYPYIQISSCSVAVPISGGRSGGWEYDALNYLAKHGGVSVDLWPNNSTSRSLMNDPACQADRSNHVALEYLTIKGRNFDAYMTAALMTLPQAWAYNDWRHVIMGCDGVSLAPKKYGLRGRNNWGRWGAANRFGKYGYAVFQEGARSHGCPDSGVVIRVVTPPDKKVA